MSDAPMPKTLILIRHAHRDTTRREADNGLSEKGRAQAAALLKHYLKVFPPFETPVKPWVVSSPKRRCVETVIAIAHEAGVKVHESEDLLEQQEGETEAALRRRVERFVSLWRKEAPLLTIACSHGDWLPLALESLTGAHAELRKGAWSEVHLDEKGRPLLSWLIQSFKNL